jgi:hypothetical protein
LELADDERFGVFQGMDCGLATDRGEILKEIIQSLAAFQIVQQGLEWDARSSEDRRPPEDFWVLGDDFIFWSAHDFDPS